MDISRLLSLPQLAIVALAEKARKLMTWIFSKTTDNSAMAVLIITDSEVRLYLESLQEDAEPPREFLHKVIDAWNYAKPSQSLQEQEIRSVLSYIEVSINSDRSLKLAASVIARVYEIIPVAEEGCSKSSSSRIFAFETLSPSAH